MSTALTCGVWKEDCAARNLVVLWWLLHCNTETGWLEHWLLPGLGGAAHAVLPQLAHCPDSRPRASL